MTAAQEGMVGQKIANYIIEKGLGSGGMGAVYRGVHESLDYPVAIKVINIQGLDGNSEVLERFKAEAKALRDLKDNPNIANMLHFSVDPPAIITELIEGKDLQRCLSEEGELRDLKVQLRYFDMILKVIGALKFAHEKGVIHRDIKPENIMVPDCMAQELDPKIIDFGISHLKAEQSVKLTTAHSVMGSILWAAPEQLRTPDRIDHRVDIFSAGMLLYHLFSGGAHFYSDVQLEKMSVVESIEFAVGFIKDKKSVEVKLSTLLPEIATVIRECVAFDPDERISSMGDLEEACRALRSFLMLRRRGIVKHAPSNVVQPVVKTFSFTDPGVREDKAKAETVLSTEEVTMPRGKSRNKRKLLFAGLVLLLGIGIGAAGIKLTSGNSAPPARRTAAAKKPGSQTDAVQKPSKKPLRKAKVPAVSDSATKKSRQRFPKKGKIPSNSFIRNLYEKEFEWCRQNDPKSHRYKKSPGLHLNCLRKRAVKINKAGYPEVASLLIHEVRCRFCLYERLRHDSALKAFCDYALRTRKAFLKPLSGKRATPILKKIGERQPLRERYRKQFRKKKKKPSK